jgi:transposase
VVTGLKHQKEKRSMDYFAGLDVSVKDTSVCIVDGTGKIVREVKVASEPQALLAVLRNATYCFKRIGLEAGPLSQWLYGALAETGLPVICVETRHMRAVLKAQINKTDRNDARGMAQMMRVGLYRPVHVKTLRSQKLRMLLTHRKLVQSKAIALDNDLRGTLRNFGLKVGVVGTVKFEARVRELVENLPDVAELVEPLLIVRQVLREQLGILHRRLLAIVRDDDVCRRLMTIPGVGPVVALTYRATVDVPVRFRKSKSVGAVFGLTCAKYQSGEIDRTGAISRCGDEMVRTTLYEAAQILLVRSTKWSWLKAWAMQIARRRGMRRAIVALARRLAVIMHRIYGPAARCKGIRTEWSFWSALIYPALRGSSCSGPSWLSAHT